MKKIKTKAIEQKPALVQITDQVEIARLRKRGKWVHPIWYPASDGTLWLEKV